ncbi:MAG TPA: NAD(P)-dependent oxidoreductase [Spirochaetia bacterium]|nr:NAD(P)-dependent oxidoreductase [Spirochaetia bacterium]
MTSHDDLTVGKNLTRFPDLHPALDQRSAVTEANRCLNCFDAPCMSACPTHIDVPGFIKKIASGNLPGSARTILDSNVLGMSCSRVCPVEVLCEGACVMHRYNEKPIEIGRLQRHAMEDFFSRGALLPMAKDRRREKVACVGGGPASLSCAAELARQGYSVTVFDNRPFPGGLTTYGVAEYKLRPSDSLKEVEMIRSLGVEFRRAEVGGDVPLDELEQEFSFVFLGVGLGAMQRLGIPGEDTPGVIDALHFIERYKTDPDFPIGSVVAVFGGGNTALDAANAARRLGADDVHLFYRRTEAEMPAFPFEFDHSKVEGVQFHWLSQPVEILERDGRVVGVTFVRTRPGAPDATGRRAVEPVQGSEFEFPCDMVIPALGQGRLLEMLRTTKGIQMDNGSIRVDRPTGQTANPKYFAGGDCVNGGREVVDAVADGKRAALAMARKLSTAEGR